MEGVGLAGRLNLEGRRKSQVEGKAGVMGKSEVGGRWGWARKGKQVKTGEQRKRQR